MVLTSLQAIQQLRNGDKQILRNERWLLYLYVTEQKNVNLEQVQSLSTIGENPVLQYTERTLQILNSMLLPSKQKELIEDVLKWSEVAKCGSRHHRKEWESKGHPLAIHNIASARIYASEQLKEPFSKRDLVREEMVYTLIWTHGLIGQYLRGEVRYSQLLPLCDLPSLSLFPSADLYAILYSLNQCIIEGVSPALWEQVQGQVAEVIQSLVDGKNKQDLSYTERLKRLRYGSIGKGENFQEELERLSSHKDVLNRLSLLLNKVDVWYVESALSEFTFEEFIKIFLHFIRSANSLTVSQITFEPLMRDLYYDYKGKKSVNLYKKRIIEAYLGELSIEQLLFEELPPNKHVAFQVFPYDVGHALMGVSFAFSKAGQKLIEFCQEAEKDPLYERSIIMLYDFFGFRKDAYDRLQNEQTYLLDMNNSQDYKKKIADYAVGTHMADIGPGSGFLLDLLTERHPQANVVGIDIASNVVAELQRKKNREKKTWNVLQGDALDLVKYVGKERLDTICFSSIIHEMFSYIPYNGKKFNSEVVSQALRSSFDVLNPYGRIIIRDGIMTEPKDSLRLIRFKERSGIEFFKRYVQDFKGRTIAYEWVDDQTVRLPVNDGMEFLYTFTWGEEAYPHEVQEQFGYFTPSEYKQCIQSALGDSADILVFEHYLQEGYEEHLLDKVAWYNEKGEIIPLPDSTCFIVIEKKK